MNLTAILTFLLFVAITLYITWRAARQTSTTHDFYAAGENISGLQNGLAIAGDAISAAALLGTTGLVFLAGYDSLFFVFGPTIGFALIMLLIVDPLRNLGRHTFTDVLAFRLATTPTRIIGASNTLIVCIAYLVAQIVGAGLLVSNLFQLPYEAAVVVVGVLMMLYVSFGGMLATTWVQITKAILLLFGITVLLVGVLWQFDFDITKLASAAMDVHERGPALMLPGAIFNDPISLVSLVMAFIFGIAGLPHLLMRFFTVPDVRQARRSIVVTTVCMAYFSSIVFFLGLGAIALVSNRPEFHDEAGRVLGGSNMAAIHLSSIIGGDLLLGFLSAVAFATILAVVSGLMISAVSAISHDLYANVIRRGRADERTELALARISTVIIGAIVIALSWLARDHNVTILVTLAMAIAASANFPSLLLAIHWRGFTTRGLIAAGCVGLASSTILIIVGPVVWVDMLGFEQPLFPYLYPTLFSMTAAFVAAWLFSVTDRSQRGNAERQRYFLQHVRSEIGVARE